MRLPLLFRRRKSRKYLIKRDNEGRSLRARCFGRFEQGRRPAEVAEELSMKVPTVCRYFRDWRRIGPNFDRKYAFVKELFKKTASDRERNIELFARNLGIGKEQLEEILSKPHGLRQLTTGKLYFPVQAQADHKRHVALAVGLLISEFLINEGGKFEDLYSALRTLLRMNMRNREREEADIAEENKMMTFFHQVLAVDMEIERKNQIKPDRFSDKEVDHISKIELKSLTKEIEPWYWKKVAALAFKGFTPEQAREKLYQDVSGKGDLQIAKAMRAFQDAVHPLKSDAQASPSSYIQPQQST